MAPASTMAVRGNGSESLPAVAQPRLPYHPAVEDKFGIDKASWKALVEAVFPNASTTDSVILALSYCKARHLDPFKRNVHIVPIWDKNKRQMVDTVWPGIGEIRTTAFRTRLYAGREPTRFGPDKSHQWTSESGKAIEIVFPEWAQVTVYRLVDGKPVAFAGPQVYWMETYASGKDGVPNTMWQRRARGQLDKCAEASALRAAFPEELGDEPTSDEAGAWMNQGGIPVEPKQIVEPENVGGVEGLKSRMMQAAKPENEAGAGEGEAAQDQTKPAADPSPTSTQEAPQSDPTSPTPEPVSTGAEGTQNADTTHGTEPAGNQTTKAAADTPKANGKTLYRCKDNDCESQGKPFNNPTKIKSGKKAGTLICPHCAGENIEVVTETQQNVDQNAFDTAPTSADVQTVTGGVVTCPAGHVVARNSLIQSAVVGRNGLGLCPTCKQQGRNSIIRES